MDSNSSAVTSHRQYHSRWLWGGKMSSAFFSLRRYPLIFVVKTAQNRPSDDLASRWRAGPSRRPRGALKTECAMRPGTVVVRHVLSQYPPGVPLIDDDHVVQTLLTQCAYDPLGNRVCLGSLDRGEDGLDAEPCCLWDETPSIAAVPVADQAPGLVSPRGCLNELAPDLLGSGVSSHIEMYQPSPQVGDEEEDVEGLEGECLDGEEVGCPDVGCVVPEKGAPGLGRRAASGFSAVAADRASADAVAQLAEFPHDAHAAPAGILPSQASNQLLNLTWHPRSPRTPPMSALPGPVPPPCCPLPADYSLRLHQHQGGPPTRPRPR